MFRNGRLVCKQFHVYPDGLNEAQVLIWVGNGNSWHNLSHASKLNGRVQEYGDLVAAMSKNWECRFYITAGRTPIP